MNLNPLAVLCLSTACFFSPSPVLPIETAAHTQLVDSGHPQKLLKTASIHRPDFPDLPQPTHDSLNAPPGPAAPKRRLYFGLQIGAQFMELEQKNLFVNDLNEFIRHKYMADSLQADKFASHDSSRSLKTNQSRILQPYDQVMVAFPAGLVLGIPITRHLDFYLNSMSFWKQQEALVESRLPDTISSASQDTSQGQLYNVSRKYTIQANLAGCGFKLYIPFNFLSIKNDKSIYISYVQFWNLGKSELYSNQGCSPSNSPLLGIGYEISIGFQVSAWSQIGVLGNLAVNKLKFPASGKWSSVLLQPSDDKMEWEINSLKFNFQFIYQLGGFSSISKK